MRLAIIGAGRVGRALGTGWERVGHDVVYGVRDPADGRHAGLGAVASVDEAIVGADACLVALPWAVVEEVLSPLSFGTTVVLDATNPLAAGAPELAADPSLAGAELVARWSGSDRVVKAFNTTGSANMEDPGYGATRPMMPIAGDDAGAKSIASALAEELGFEGIDTGPLAAARDLEHLAMIWIRLAYPLGNGSDIAFALLRR